MSQKLSSNLLKLSEVDQINNFDLSSFSDEWSLLSRTLSQMSLGSGSEKEIVEKEINKVIKKHSKSFSFATCFLPTKEKKAIRLLYAFCRFYDDQVDENPRASAQLIENLQKDFNSHSPQVLINQLFQQLCKDFAVPNKYPNDLIDGCKRDLVQKKYETFSELCDYCYQVASTVGLMSSYILGFDKSKECEVVEYAVKAGIALQLTNIIRDVAEDLKRGRIYIAKEDFETCGCAYENSNDWKDSFEFKKLILLQINRAKSLYKESHKGLRYLNFVPRLSVSVAFVIYEEILYQVVKKNYDVLSQRVYVSFLTKLLLLPKALLLMRNDKH